MAWTSARFAARRVRPSVGCFAFVVGDNDGGDAMTTATSDPEYVPLGIAARRVGISRVTLRDRVRSGEVPAYVDPRDRRFTLVKVADVDRLRQPRPREEAAAVA